MLTEASADYKSVPVAVPNKSEITQEEHLLNKLRQNDLPVSDLKATLLSFPYSELKSLTSKLTEDTTGK